MFVFVWDLGCCDSHKMVCLRKQSEPVRRGPGVWGQSPPDLVEDVCYREDWGQRGSGEEWEVRGVQNGRMGAWFMKQKHMVVGRAWVVCLGQLV